jgi:glutathione peroxidase-family protein
MDIKLVDLRTGNNRMVKEILEEKRFLLVVNIASACGFT